MRPRRQVPRYIAEMKAAVSQPPGGTAFNVTAVNLSVLGCCLEGAGLLKPSEPCELTFEWEGKQFHAQAEVTWKSSKGEAGLRFHELDPASKDLLRRICANLRLQPMAPLPPETELK